MDTIKTYLDSLFASLPDNAKTQQAKTDMLANMRDYYRDLLRDGKSEEEAIGAVISAFGSLDELRADLGLPVQSDPNRAEAAADDDAITESELRHFGKALTILPHKSRLAYCYAASASPYLLMPAPLVMKCSGSSACSY